MKKIILLLFPSVIFLALNACGAKSDDKNNGDNDSSENSKISKDEKNDRTSSEPTREKMLEDLNFLYRKIISGKIDEAKKFLLIPSSESERDLESDLESDLNKSIERNEISAEGIAILAEKGSFGKLKDIFPEKAQSWMKRRKIKNEEECYAMSLFGAKVAGLWNGENFLFFKFDDIGQLEPGRPATNSYAADSTR